MLIAWHPSRWWDWCVPNDEKQGQKNCGDKQDLFVSGGYKKNF